MDDNVKFMDAESYSGGQNKDITFKQIVLQHVNAISGYASKEMRGSYYEDKVAKGGFVQHVYVPDTRDVYSNSVNYLADILFPHFDKEMREAERFTIAEFDRELKKIRELKDVSDDTKTQEYSQMNFRNKRKLFRHLCSFLHRIKYLDLGMLEE
jgi:hypothetical protein